jgi:predicted nuclease with TOPRIM domain
MGKDKIGAEQSQGAAAAAVSSEETLALLQSENAELRSQLDAANDKLKALVEEKSELTIQLDAAHTKLTEKTVEFEKYKADAKEMLDHIQEEASKKQLIVSDRPVLNVGGDLFVFKMSKFTLDGKHFSAQMIMENPGAFEVEITQLIHKYKILKPFKAKEA